MKKLYKASGIVSYEISVEFEDDGELDLKDQALGALMEEVHGDARDSAEIDHIEVTPIICKKDGVSYV